MSDFLDNVDINWSKTFCMIFTKRYIIVPETINLCGNEIKVVKDILPYFKYCSD